jgi:hypothetical protein
MHVIAEDSYFLTKLVLWNNCTAHCVNVNYSPLLFTALNLVPKSDVIRTIFLDSEVVSS